MGIFAVFLRLQAEAWTCAGPKLHPLQRLDTQQVEGVLQCGSCCGTQLGAGGSKRRRFRGEDGTFVVKRREDPGGIERVLRNGRDVALPQRGGNDFGEPGEFDDKRPFCVGYDGIGFDRK